MESLSEEKENLTPFFKIISLVLFSIKVSRSGIKRNGGENSH